MKTALFGFITGIIPLATTLPAFAASSDTVSSSGAFLLIFLGFCAFVVMAQLIPAIITLWGMVRGVAEKKKTVHIPK